MGYEENQVTEVDYASTIAAIRWMSNAIENAALEALARDPRKGRQIIEGMQCAVDEITALQAVSGCSGDADCYGIWKCCQDGACRPQCKEMQ